MENMMSNASLIVCLALATLAAGCSKSPAPPLDTRAADAQVVSDIEAALFKDAAAKDADKWATYFTEDASGLFPGDGMLNGRAAIRAAMATYFADPNFSLTLQSTQAIASKGGDMAYSQGTYTMTVTNAKTKTPMTDKGKYLTVYTRQPDRSWKAVAHAFNSDSPVP
jgi:uncharacterized protein (TIGR02246 family)